MKITIKMPSPQGVAASSTIVTPLPIGFSYESLYLVYGGASFVLASMIAIRLVANGQIIMQYASGTDCDSINQFNGRASAATAKILMIDMVRFNQKTKEAIEATKLGTGLPPDNNQTVAGPGGQQVKNKNYNPYPVQTLQLEIDTNATSAAPTLTVYAKLSAAAPTGVVRKVRLITYTPNSTQWELADLPKGDLIDKVFFKTSGHPQLTNVILLKDQVKQYDRTNTLNTAIQTDGKYRTVQTGWFVHDTTEEGFGSETVQTQGVNDLRYQLTFSATYGGNTMPTYVDYLGHLTR